MVKRPTWLGGKPTEPTTLEDQELRDRMDTKAGLTDLKGEYEQLRNRILFTDESICAQIDYIRQQLTQLQDISIDKRTEQHKAEIIRLEHKYTLWLFYRQFKKASMPWAISGKDRGMNKKFESLEVSFFINLEDESMYEPMLMALQKNIDDCYREEWHVKPSPTILINKAIMMTQQSGGAIRPTSDQPIVKPPTEPRTDVQK